MSLFFGWFLYWWESVHHGNVNDDICKTMNEIVDYYIEREKEWLNGFNGYAIEDKFKNGKMKLWRTSTNTIKNTIKLSFYSSEEVKHPVEVSIDLHDITIYEGIFTYYVMKSKDGIEKLLTDNIFAPLQKDRVCNNIGVIHKDKNDVDIDIIVAEVGKPLNISEGWGGKCTLIAVSGMSFPVDHIQRLGKLAVDGQKERQHNIEMAKGHSLPTLEFNDIEKPKIKGDIDKPKLTGRDALLAMRKKASA